MRFLIMMAGGLLAGVLYGLSLGGEVCFFVPEGGVPSLEFSAWQEARLPYGWFWEVGGLYYRIFGVGVQGTKGVKPVFSGDMVGGMIAAGWQIQVGKWQGALRLMGGGGYLGNLEMRESEMRRFVSEEGWGAPVVVERALVSGVGVLGWGASLATSYQWRRLRVGLVVGWMDVEGMGNAHLEWKELRSGSLESHEVGRQLYFLLRGLRIGGAIRILL